MVNVISAWNQLNQDAYKVCKEAVTRMLSRDTEGPFIDICGAFLQKGAETLSAVNILNENNLEEPAQALIRILFELRINFDCFLVMSYRNLDDAISRVFHSMMLEKIKQARAAEFLGIPIELQEKLINEEKVIAANYDPDDFKKLRRYGFTGLPVEQRASMTGHEAAYNVVYRNFSRNIHSTDYVENYLKAGLLSSSEKEQYIESRDVVANYVAHFSAVGIVEFTNGIFKLELEKELDGLGKRQKEIKTLNSDINN